MRPYDHPLNQIKRDYQATRARLIAFLLAIPGRHLSNIHDPKAPWAFRYFPVSYHAYGDWRASQFEWQMHLRWINENIITRPKGTCWYSVERLEKMHMVGLRQPLYRTLSSLDQIAWMLFGMRKPTVERVARRVLTIVASWLPTTKNTQLQKLNLTSM